MTEGEQVLVIERAAVMPDGGWHGLRTNGMDEVLALIRAGAQYRPRVEMERDPAWKQLIPYLVVRDAERYFLMQRTRAGGDDRLHDHWSIGVGGHVNPGDDGLLGGLRREWREELVAAVEPAFQPIALLNDDSTDVGSVHLGIVFVVDAAGQPIEVRETDKLRGAFADRAEVAAVRDGLETWSRLVFDAIESGLVGSVGSVGSVARW